MWFEVLMDDFKRALFISSKYKGVFIPIFLKLAMYLILVVVIGIGIVISIASGIFAGVSKEEALKVILRFLVPTGFFLILGYVIYMILWSLIEVGSINLYYAAIIDEKPGKEHFFKGIKTYLGKVLSGKLLIHFVVLIVSPIWLALFILYFILVGIPTAGWGVVFLAVGIGAFFASWTIAIVHDDLGPIDGIKASFRLAKNHFKPLFIIILAVSMVTQYAVNLFGPIGLLLGGWFIGGILRTYFKIVIYLTYLMYSSKKEIST